MLVLWFRVRYNPDDHLYRQTPFIVKVWKKASWIALQL